MSWAANAEANAINSAARQKARELRTAIANYEMGKATSQRVQRKMLEYREAQTRALVSEMHRGRTLADAQEQQDKGLWNWLRSKNPIRKAFARFFDQERHDQDARDFDELINSLAEMGLVDPQYGSPKENFRDLFPAEQENAELAINSGARASAPNKAEWSEEKFTPASSHVYSFLYNYKTKTMYVRYKQVIVNADAVLNYRGAGGLRSMAGDLGRTIARERPNEPGPMYAYFDVPVGVFGRLRDASSAGTAVWDELRMRGSVFGHQFQYSLVDAPTTAGDGGEEAHYVPRRATSWGFRSRTYVPPGRGRRPFANATLPEQRGHDTFTNPSALWNRGRPTPPDRGRPDPPSRGR